MSLRDMLSGKTARWGRLIAKSAETVSAKIEHLPKNHPVRQYAFANGVAVCCFMESIFFETPEHLSPFAKAQKTISEQQARNLFKLATARYLVAFMQNPANLSWVENYHGSADDFVRQVLTISGLTEADQQGLFLDLWKSYKNAVEQENLSAYGFRVFRHAQQLTLGLPFDAPVDPFAASVFTRFSSLYYETLVRQLSESIRS